MKSTEPNDDDLIRGCRENDRKSQEMLYRRYARSMFCLCLIYESDRDKAKDVLQESFIKIFRNIRSFDRKGSLTGWMKAIITHTAIDHYRKSVNEAQFIPIENITQPYSKEESVTSILNTEDIISQVNRLPSGARLIFQLHAIEGYSHKEIADLLHISEGTSKSQINRAKQLLQHWIGGKDIKHGIIVQKGQNIGLLSPRG
jgi:RNA polymerase sigma-70 factor, ECF subfamily